MNNSAKSLPCRDPNAELRALYMDLLRNQSHFDEFHHLLALYQPSDVTPAGSETDRAREVRRRLNDRIREWLAMDIEGLTACQVLQWRAIVVEDCFGSNRPAVRSGAF